MPNWCNSTIYFYSKDKSTIQNFKDKVVKIYNSTATVENGFGKGWLGDYVNTLLAPEYHTDKDNNPPCRGRLEFYDEPGIIKYDGYWHFRIHTETAWTPMLEMWQMILKRHYPKIKIAFLAEEPGCEIYIKYDPDNVFFQFDNYYVEYDIEGYGDEYFDNLDDAANYIANIQELELSKGQLLGKTAAEMAETANSAAQQLNKINWLSIHEFQEVELDEVG
jgi:hypothetical protein